MGVEIAPAEARYAVELFFDPESHNWGFEVPSLAIVGGGATRAAAIRQARDAIAFTLEGEGNSSGHALQRDGLSRPSPK